jgi:hypothetical protein
MGAIFISNAKIPLLKPLLFQPGFDATDFPIRLKTERKKNQRYFFTARPR